MLQREIDPEIRADIEKFEEQLERYLAGDLEEDAFRVFRLNNGIYGQRQGGHNQMVRVKVPYGSITAEQLDMFAHIAETYSRGWGHLTTRQNMQFHFVDLEQIPAVLRDMASVGLTSREACGDTVRNVMGCHLAGACPYEALDISPWAEAAFQHFLHNPLAQRLPRKFKINFSGCETDCGQAMFNDVGVIATTRTLDDGTREAGFRVFVAGGLGANPHPALALEEFTPREDLMATLEADPARVLQPRQPRQQAPGPHEVARRHDGLGRPAGPHPQGAQAPRRVVHLARRHPRGRPEAGRRARRPRPRASPTTASARARPSRSAATIPTRRGTTPTSCAASPRAPCPPIAYARLGDITTAQLRALASIQRELGAEVRITNRQNLVFRGLSEGQLPLLHQRLSRHRDGRARRRAVPRRRRLPGCRHLQPGRHPEPGPGRRHRRRPRRRGARRRRRHPHEHLRLHEQLRPAPHLRHRLLRRRAPGPRPVGPGLPAPARRLRRPGEDPLRREGPPPAGQERPRGRRARRAALQRRAAGRRGVPVLDRPLRWRQGPSPTSCATSTSSPRPRTAPSTTSTTARPAPTWPRPANRSARRERSSRWPTSPTRSWRSSTASSSTCPRPRSSSGRSTASPPTSASAPR